jgi:thiol-disulfide isomerase/thioredoxin
MRCVSATMKQLFAAGAARIIPFGRAVHGFDVTAAGTALLLALFILVGPTPPASTADIPLPAFGEGAVEVRVYTDYFCEPCRAEEQEVMSVITELVAKNRIRVIFIDTPLHPETVLYAGYFLAAMNAKREYGQAVKARAALFEAAGMQIRGKSELESFLTRNGLEFRTFDTAPVFAIYSKYIKEDRINATPTVVLLSPQGKTIPGNKEQILKALRDLRK